MCNLLQELKTQETDLHASLSRLTSLSRDVEVCFATMDQLNKQAAAKKAQLQVCAGWICGMIGCGVMLRPGWLDSYRGNREVAVQARASVCTVFVHGCPP
jgi:hypothetical protein